MLEKIISGGQTGADRAALDIAIEFGINHGGWCPLGRLAEDGMISQRYNLKETSTPDYSQRTIANIMDSDATLIYVPSFPLKIKDGTVLTYQTIIEAKKKYLLISLDDNENTNNLKILWWLKENDIRCLNIAGPRESVHNGIYNYVYNSLKNILNIYYSNNLTKEITNRCKL